MEDALSIVLRLVGAFYLIAAIVGLRSVAMDRFLSVALAAITLAPETPADRADRLRNRFLLASSLAVGLSGLATLLLLDVAAILFPATLALQLVYLFVLAPRIVDPVDPPEPGTRTRSHAATAIMAAACLFVLSGWQAGLLVPILTSWPLASVFAVGTAGLGFYALRLFRPPGRWPNRDLDADSVDLEPSSGDAHRDADPGFSPAEGGVALTLRAVKVMADYSCDPLWFHEDERVGCIAPASLGLSDALVSDLGDWASAFDRSLDMNDPGGPVLWSVDGAEAHLRQGRALAHRLRAELDATGRRDVRVVYHPIGGTLEETR